MYKGGISIKLAHLLWIGIALIPAVLAAVFVGLRGLPIPIGDQWWDPVHVAVLTRQGRLSAHDLFAYSEGHRLVNIRIITWLMTILTDYNPILMNSATWVFSVINVLLAYRLLCNQRTSTHRLPRNVRLAGLALFSATLFCITHGQAWIDFYFSQWQLSFLFVLLAGAMVQAWPGSWRSFLALLSMAGLPSFSCGLGLGSWVAIPMMASSRKSYRRLSTLLAWMVACGLFSVFYFSDYARVAGKTIVETSSLSNPKTWLLALGFSLSRRSSPTRVILSSQRSF